MKDVIPVPQNLAELRTPNILSSLAYLQVSEAQVEQLLVRIILCKCH